MNTRVTLPPLQRLFEGDSESRNAYARLLFFESQEVILIRMLGQAYALVQAPALGVRAFLAARINSLLTDHDIIQLGSQYLNYFIDYFQNASRSRAVQRSSAHSLRSFPDEVKDIQAISDTLMQVPQNHSEAKRMALLRDGHRCMVTRVVDNAPIEDCLRLRAYHYPTPIYSSSCGLYPDYSSLSGAVEHIQRVLRDAETIKMLSEDSSPTELISQPSHRESVVVV
ncbi:unnamed protein product [Rhizoctonia solani]|uniref:Uncharacterized protein n=1 Tax=Rhizoctonia solani TaxID=456999 RepID=A0A8H3BCA9_9AGAM|nr:unnamed protein product [Rhizoctonia solani]CAE6453848.1 unnamed protein product [Rhizoctonia solani]